ncbi:MAG: DUF4330 domain-containing protein [Ruminococcaceae bacterium]|nr:DUF4330 domain-containing protein [Oscillospiraceae bacterium]
MKKLNIIDIFIILFAVLTLVGIGVRMAANVYLREKNNAEYTVSVKISSVDEAKENAIAVNDEVYVPKSAEAFGVIASVEAIRYLPDTAHDNSGVAMDNIKCDILCEITVKGSETENGFLLESGEYLYAGMKLEIKTTGYEGPCVVMGITNKNR